MTTKYSIEVLNGITGIDPKIWNSLVGDGSPFLEHGFLSALEITSCVNAQSGWIPQIFIARIQGNAPKKHQSIVGALPLYLKYNSSGEFVFDWSWAEAATRAGMAYYPKAVVGVPFTPVTGARLLIAPDAEDPREVRLMLAAAAIQFAEENELSSVHFNFIADDEIKVFSELGLPVRLGLQYHWKNDDYTSFDDFLGRFRSKRRANIRRERKKLSDQGVSTQIQTGEAISTADLQRAFSYYQDTVHKFYHGQQYLNREFFEVLATTLPERLHLLTAFQDGKPFAGAFNLFKGDRLYGRYWGAKKDIEFTHFEVCMYQAISWCIENNILAFEPGAGGEHKFERGFTPTRTYSAHFIRDPRLRLPIANFITHERTQIEAHIVYLMNESPINN